MRKKTNISTVALVITLIIIVIAIFAFFLGYIQLEQIHTYSSGDYVILRLRNNNKPPYKGFECQHSSRYFFINCGFTKVLENSTDLEGGK